MQRAIMLLLLLVLLQNVKAQAITLLASQSNCANIFFIDYIATAKLQEQQLIVSGELVGTGDSILQVIFSVENITNDIRKNEKEKNDCFINKAKWQQDKLERFFYCDHIKNIIEIKINDIKFISKNEITIYIDLIEKSITKEIKKEAQLVLVCTAIYKNGCKYIKKEKIHFTY